MCKQKIYLSDSDITKLRMLAKKDYESGDIAYVFLVNVNYNKKHMQYT